MYNRLTTSAKKRFSKWLKNKSTLPEHKRFLKSAVNEFLCFTYMISGAFVILLMLSYYVLPFLIHLVFEILMSIFVGFVIIHYPSNSELLINKMIKEGGSNHKAQTLIHFCNLTDAIIADTEKQDNSTYENYEELEEILFEAYDPYTNLSVSEINTIFGSYNEVFKPFFTDCLNEIYCNVTKNISNNQKESLDSRLTKIKSEIDVIHFVDSLLCDLNLGRELESDPIFYDNRRHILNASVGYLCLVKPQSDIRPINMASVQEIVKNIFEHNINECVISTNKFVHDEFRKAYIISPKLNFSSAITISTAFDNMQEKDGAILTENGCKKRAVEMVEFLFENKPLSDLNKLLAVCKKEREITNILTDFSTRL